MPRRAAKVDENQAEIVDIIRKLGASVAITSGCGDGFPDIVVGLHGVNVLVEIKDGNKEPSRRRLTPDQVKFHEQWKGDIRIIETVDEAIELVAEIRQNSSTLNK